MPFHYEVLADQELLRVLARGRVDFDDCLAVLRRVTADQRFLPQYRVLADFRGVKYTPSIRDLHGFVEPVRVVRQAFQGRTALVVTGWVHLGLARVACSLGRLLSLEMSAFDDLARAHQWLGLPSPPAASPQSTLP